jgi:hypothetical protein
VPAPRIVACGGAIFDGAERLQRFILSLARVKNPRVCFIPTATGDHPEAVARFYRAAAGLDCRPSDLPLFQRQVEDLEEHLLGQDVIWVAGGNTANALAVWRVHGLDRILRMGRVARSETVQAKQAFVMRDVAMAEDLVRQDREINRLNREVFQLAIDVGTDADTREWAMHMVMVARALERVGDNAVDVGEQTAFVVSGLFREFSDSSTPAVPRSPSA